MSDTLTAASCKTILAAQRGNAELLGSLVSAINSWDGSLDSFEVMDFDDDFFSTYFDGKPEEAARAVFFGNVQNWMDDYIRFNGYGNLESLSTYQHERELTESADEITTRALELRDEIDLDDLVADYVADEVARA